MPASTKPHGASAWDFCKWVSAVSTSPWRRATILFADLVASTTWRVQLGEADAYFAQPAAMNARIGAKYCAASTDLWWGKMLAERNGSGDPEKARELLTKARTIAAANKYGIVEGRAIEALSRLA